MLHYNNVMNIQLHYYTYKEWNFTIKIIYVIFIDSKKVDSNEYSYFI